MKNIVRLTLLGVLCSAMMANPYISTADSGAPKPPKAAATTQPKAIATPIIKVDDKKAIMNVVSSYIDALKAKDSKAALGLIDSKTVVWYQQALDYALTAKRSALKNIPLIQRIIVLRLRNEFPKADLLEMDGAAVFGKGIELGWIDSNSVATLKIANVKVSGNQGQASTQSAPSVYVLNFVKESGEWRLSFTRLLTLLEPEVKKFVKSSGQSEDEFIARVIGASSGNTYDEAIFDGPLAEVTPVDTQSGEAQTLQDDEARVSIVVSSGWRKVTNMNDAAIVQAANASQEKYMMVISDDKDIVDNFDAFISTILDGLPNRLKNVKIDKPVRLKINGLPAVQYKVNGQISSLNLTYLFNFVEGEKAYYQILLWTLQDRYVKHESDFKTVASSFREE